MPPTTRRADARANHDLLLDAAAALFAEQGVDAPLYLIAQRADVGPGTLYRHFPDRRAVVAALAERAAARFGQIVADAAHAPTGWDGLLTYIDDVVDLYLAYPWLPAVLDRMRRDPPDGWAPGQRDAAVAAAVTRAQVEGDLRSDVTLTDVVFIPTLLSSLLTLPDPPRTDVLRRQRALLLDALRAKDGPHPPLPAPPVSDEALAKAIRPHRPDDPGSPPRPPR